MKKHIYDNQNGQVYKMLPRFLLFAWLSSQQIGVNQQYMLRT